MFSKIRRFVGKTAIALITVMMLTPFFMQTSAQATGTGDPLDGVTTNVGPGAEWTSRSIDASGGKQSVNIVKVDTANQWINIDVSLGQGQVLGLETVSSQAKRRSSGEARVIAAVNGDFFSYGTTTGVPSGMVMKNGELLVSPTTRYAVGFQANGQPVIDQVSFSGQVTPAAGEPVLLNGVNRNRGTDALTLYTPSYASSTRTNDSGTEVVLTGVNLPLRPGQALTGTVSQKVNNKGDTIIPKDGVVLSAHGAARGFLWSGLREGDQVSIIVNLYGPWNGILNAVGSGEQLVKDGKIDIQTDNEDRSTGNYARTAVGINGKELILVTVDRNAAAGTKGMDLKNLAQLMVELGARHAINLDGGGSTTMVARIPGESVVSLINRPGDTQERAVSTSLQVISNAPLGPLAGLSIRPAPVNAVPAEKFMMTAKGWDQYMNAVEVSPGDIRWHVDPALGDITPEGLFQAGFRGKGQITATVGGVNGSTPVEILEPAAVFADVPPEQWAFGEMMFLYSRGVIKGKTATIAEPDSQLTRAEFAAYLSRALNLTPLDGGSRFKDVNPKNWAAPAISASVQAGLITGYSDGTFRPGESVTRQQVAMILGRALLRYSGTEDIDAEQVSMILEGLADNKKVGASGRHMVALLASYNIAHILETANGRFYNPAARATRAEAAFMMAGVLRKSI
ncbi:MAG: phosphodiester glycosidase family protein [Bacillota bacterium]